MMIHNNVLVLHGLRTLIVNGCRSNGSKRRGQRKHDKSSFVHWQHNVCVFVFHEIRNADYVWLNESEQNKSLCKMAFCDAQ